MSLTRLERMAYVEIVAQVLVVDFAITLEESDFFDRVVARMALTDAERIAVCKRVNIGDDVEFEAATLGKEARSDLMETLQAAAESDGAIAPREQELLDRIAAVLSIQAAHPGLMPR